MFDRIISIRLKPRNPWLKGKLFQESKLYKKIVKQKQKLFTDNLFLQLKSMQGSDHKQYMDLVNSLRTGNFDRKKVSDIEAIGPDEWFDHFSSFLGKSVKQSKCDDEMETFSQENDDKFSSELDHPFLKSECL